MGLLVELHLRGDQLGQVAQRLRRVEDLAGNICVSEKTVRGNVVVLGSIVDSHSS